MTQREEQVEDINESEETSPYRYSITSYGADYPVDGLVKRLEAGDIVVPIFDPEVNIGDEIEGYQRRFIWTKPQCDRFVESLLLGLPVPGIFLVKQDDGRLLVLDGQQRLRTLQAFYKGVLRRRTYSLQNVQDKFEGHTYESLDAENRRKLDDSIIHATIVRQDEPSDDQSSVYMIFQRLNTGGTTLHPQEIRVALYRGKLIRLLRNMNDFRPWRQIYGRKSDRSKDQELILRFFALLFWSDRYRRPMKDFLNRYVAANKDLELQDEPELRQIFETTTEIARSAIGRRAFRPKAAINAAVMDSVMVGIANRVMVQGPIRDFEALKSKYDRLLQDKDYLSAVESATSDEENVRKRLRLSKECMLQVG